MEEDHYYPFGLTVGVGQSGQVNLPKQPFKYNGIQLEKSLGLETYETFYRGLDPQIGRFKQIDPKADATLSISPYASMDNNPVSNVDPMGDQSRSRVDDEYASALEWWANGLRQVGKDLMPFDSHSKKRGRKMSGAEEFVATVDAIMFLAMPLEMVQGESLPSKVELKMADNLAEELPAVTRAAKTLATTEKALSKAAEPFYSVAYETKIADNLYPGVYRGGHFRAANVALDKTMKEDKGFAAIMKKWVLKFQLHQQERYKANRLKTLFGIMV